MKQGEITYIGDGAYLQFTGYSFLFMANSHKDPTDVVSIELSDANRVIALMQTAMNPPVKLCTCEKPQITNDPPECTKCGLAYPAHP